MGLLGPFLYIQVLNMTTGGSESSFLQPEGEICSCEIWKVLPFSFCLGLFYWIIFLQWNLLNNVVCHLKFGTAGLRKRERDYREHNQNEFSLRCASFPIVIISKTNSYQWVPKCLLREHSYAESKQRYYMCRCRFNFPWQSLLSWFTENVGTEQENTHFHG